MEMEQNVPKRRHIKFRSLGITQKKTYNIQNTAKVWNQEGLVSFHLAEWTFLYLKHIKFRRLGITQKKTYDTRPNKYHIISSTAEVITHFTGHVSLKREDSHTKANKTKLFLTSLLFRSAISYLPYSIQLHSGINTCHCHVSLAVFFFFFFATEFSEICRH